jgi:hypothetical protein
MQSLKSAWVRTASRAVIVRIIADRRRTKRAVPTVPPVWI